MVIDLGNGVFMKDVEGTRRQRKKFALGSFVAFVTLMFIKLCGGNISWYLILAPVVIPLIFVSLICFVLGFIIVSERIW